MTPRKPRAIGTATETAVVRHLTANGFPHAERRSLRGSLDAGDITGTPGVAWSVKGGAMAGTASDRAVARWLAELERQRGNAAATVGILVLQRPGIGEPNAGRWWAIVWLSTLHEIGCRYNGPERSDADPAVRLHLADVCTLLRAAGYGDPLEVTT